MTVADAGLLSHGQLSVWRDVEGLPRHRWHEANTWTHWTVPDGVGTGRVRQALHALGARHQSLHTVYDFGDPAAPRQVLRPFDGEVGITESPAGPATAGPAATAAELLAEPFHLEREFGWRARIVTKGGRPTTVVLVKHHLTADGWCDGVLAADFRRLLHEPDLPAEPFAPGPSELADWQHSEQRARQRNAAAAHWERVFTSGRAAYPRPDGAAAGFLQCTVRSRRARAGAQAIADRAGVPLSAAVLAAYTLSLARTAGLDFVVAQLMSSNRFLPQWRDVVTSMNQWTAAPLAVDPGADLAEHAARTHRAALAAYRHGMYDVDTVADLCGRSWPHPVPYEATCAYNFLALEGPTGPGDPAGNDPEVLWEEPFSTIGHGCYLRATDEGGTSLALRLRTRDIPRDQVAAVVEGTHALLAPGLS
ncbi:condensation domain-containing protein [Kitasatospora arboriphila]|uniref:Condensation domain-containing protein n=1 Tax=Kitasatospora arboriphila TaxID=258052 RepID=A0ABP4DZX5_9ACTN